MMTATVDSVHYGDFAPLELGTLSIWPPVVLAPMAGVTNFPFRALCRRFGAGLYVSEMITARPLVEGNRKTRKLADFGPDEHPRSLQLYGVDPHFVAEAIRFLVGEGRVDHIDMNFGCPVRKVTSRGGGAAIPLKPNLLRAIVKAAVSAAEGIPITIKFRLGVSDELSTFRTAGDIAQDEGCSAVGLHARTAEQLYDGNARWEAITELKSRLSIPVWGNGDIWEATDAIRMMRETGCDGVIVGRGCLGRPWLFADLAAVFNGHPPPPPPNFGRVVETMVHHAEALAKWSGEAPAMRAFRRHSTWYTKGFRGSAQLRQSLMRVQSVEQLRTILETCDPAQPFPEKAARLPRGKTAGTQKVSLPPGYLDDLQDATPPPLESNDPGGG